MDPWEEAQAEYDNLPEMDPEVEIELAIVLLQHALSESDISLSQQERILEIMDVET